MDVNYTFFARTNIDLAFLIHSPGTVFFFYSSTLIEVILTDFEVCGDSFVLFLFTKAHFLI